MAVLIGWFLVLCLIATVVAAIVGYHKRERTLEHLESEILKARAARNEPRLNALLDAKIEFLVYGTEPHI